MRLPLFIKPDQQDDARLMLAALGMFCLSELVCAIEVYLLLRSDVFFGALHTIASALALGLFSVAIFLHLDSP